MKAYTINTLTKITAWFITAILVYLNLRMVMSGIVEYLEGPNPVYWKILIVLGLLILLTLLATVIIYPFIQKRKTAALLVIHPEAKMLGELASPEFKKVAVALDFLSQDEKLLSFAIGQGKPATEFVLIHVVESASATLLGEVSDDLESRKDEERLASYVSQLKERGYSVKGRLGYRDRKEEIVRIVKQENIDLLVMGAHGHAGMKDWIYGATINHVRHELKIPVLVVNV